MSLRPRKIDFNSTWQDLLETVKGVISCGCVQRATWNERFSDVYAICVAYPEPLSDKLYTETKNFLEQHVQELHNNVKDKSDEQLLQEYDKHWEKFSRGSGYMNNLFGYLNSKFVKNQKYSDADLNYGGFDLDLNEQMLEIGELALDTWKRFMVEPLQHKIIQLLLEQITSDRGGTTVRQSVIHGVITSLVHVEEYKKKAPLKLYEDLFETKFLRQTGEYYHGVALQYLDVCNCSEYMEKVIQRLDDENLRSRKFLHASSYTKVTKECEQRMVADHLQFLHGECKEMIIKEKKHDLANMYKLLNPIPGGLRVLVNEFETHTKQVGLEKVGGLKGDNVPQMFVENMLQVHSHYSELIRQVFQGDQQFVSALDRACASAINFTANPKSTCKSPDLLAKYCDALLKKSTKGMSETEIDDQLSKSITIFKYLDDKDIFQRCYSRMLAKRLIYSQSQSMDAEEAMINRLKQTCGYEFTNKLHRMFTDVSLSTDLNGKFNEYLKADSQELGVNASILVVMAGAWPLSPNNVPTFAIPQELEKSVRMFELFYGKNFSGRKLTWMHNLCSAELKFSHLKRPYFVTLSMFQMAVLLGFKSADTNNFKDLAAHTKLPDKELLKQLQSLIDTKILTCEDESPSEGSSFSLNMSYSNKRTKFKITSAVQKDTAQEVQQTQSAVDGDRKLYIQAAIVRIMKARKILKHNLLIQEVISQSRARFSPSVSMIKKAIEALIDKQYLERTPNSADEYSYVA